MYCLGNIIGLFSNILSPFRFLLLLFLLVVANADPRLLDGLLQVCSVFDLYPVFNFAFINIYLYTVPPSVFWPSS
jgi:hypothetical protein